MHFVFAYLIDSGRYLNFCWEASKISGSEIKSTVNKDKISFNSIPLYYHTTYVGQKSITWGKGSTNKGFSDIFMLFWHVWIELAITTTKKDSTIVVWKLVQQGNELLHI